MNRSVKIRERHLAELEAEFKPILIGCLQMSVGGKWGLFGSYETLIPLPKPLQWQEAERVTRMAIEIQEIHKEFGSSNPVCDAFLAQRALAKLHQSNTPGEPKLAAELIETIASLDLRNT